jgi:hypothetical protein
MQMSAQQAAQPLANEKYRAWIIAYVAERKGYVRGMCTSATKKMCEAFPELTRVAGFAVNDAGGAAEHFWCVAPDGTVLDPTGSQFGWPIVEYRPFKPGDEVRVGRCMHCGMDIHVAVQSLDDPRAARSFCDEACRQYYAESLGL